MTTSTYRRSAGALVVASLTIGGFLSAAAWPSAAVAGMGAVLPHYKPKPCSGDDCKADDPRSNTDCQGLLCSFSSAKAMQAPMTATQAAEAQRVRAAAEAAQAQQAVAAPLPDATPKKRRHASGPQLSKATVKAPTEVAAKVPAEAASGAH